MNRIATICIIGTAAASLAGCMTDMGGAGGKPAKAPPASATLSSATGIVMGTATFTPVSGGIRLAFTGTGLPAGTHGIHIHAVGRCEGPDFTTAGGHWNPTAMKHGKENPAGPHSGDLPNLIVGADGTGKLEATLPGMLTGGEGALLDTDGASIIVHATADDYKTDPAGASGARIACGVINAG